ncbi:hypothetical protein L6R49_28520 [Myxococcota bacterium]|nr:hypothetical protein [Myxococcota bacterium]
MWEDKPPPAWLLRGLVALGLARAVLWLCGGRVVQAGLIQLLVSPLPLVFDRPGFFSTFTLEVHQGEETHRLPMTKARFAQIRGPMVRRAVLTHTLAYGAGLPEPLRDRVAQHFLCDPGTLLRELGAPSPPDSASFITITPHTNEGGVLNVRCSP